MLGLVAYFLHSYPFLRYTRHMYIAILGRQPALGVAELECLYGAAAVRWFGAQAATITSDTFAFERLGGSQKAGRVVLELRGNWLAVSRQIVRHYSAQWQGAPHKITLGISAYGFSVTAREVQKTGLILKTKLRATGTSLRLIPNAAPALNTATSHHNKLGRSPHHIELLVVRAQDGRVIVAESVGAQNISALAARDQARPRTDAFVGMLPPKLARMMVNMAGPLVQPSPTTEHSAPRPVLLDPFCGTGTVLQEALLLGYDVRGSDLNPKMVSYTSENLAWLQRRSTAATPGAVQDVTQADATTHQWADAQQLSAVVCETYLGQPFSAPPAPAKLSTVRTTCNHIISHFLSNLRPQLRPGTPLVIAVPAWRSSDGQFTHLPLITQLERLGYQRRSLQHVHPVDLCYYRENQVVARELLVMEAMK